MHINLSFMSKESMLHDGENYKSQLLTPHLQNNDYGRRFRGANKGVNFLHEDTIGHRTEMKKYT